MNNIIEKSFPILELKQVNLARSIDSSYILKDLSFKLWKGDRLAIIGGNGSGKTTLLKLLNRLNTPTNGEIYLENIAFKETPIIQLRTQVVLVPSEPKLLGMKVKETLTYPLVLQKLPKVEIQQRLETWINQLKISEDWLERNELELSLGQRQLVTIARALMMQPKILLLDEPTSALDIANTSNLIKHLINLSVNNYLTIIMVNHQLDIAKQFANRVIYLENGKITENCDNLNLDWHNFQEKLKQTGALDGQEWLE